MNPIACYHYTYGVGGEHNRKIQFFRADDNAIFADIEFLQNETKNWIHLCKVPDTQILVEMMSTSKKVEQMRAARDGYGKFEKLPDQMLSQLTKSTQDTILSELNRENGRRIEILNDIGGDYGLEKVVQLNIFDPR